MSTIVAPDTEFLLSPDQLAERRKRQEELEKYREEIKKESSGTVETGRIKPLHEVDPKQALLDKYSEVIKNVPVHGFGLVVAIYRRPEKTKGGVILSSQNLDEDIYQGKVGLVIKTGPWPASEDDLHYFDGRLPQVGDWVVFNASDGKAFGLLDKKGDCRFIKNRQSIWMTIPEPDMVW